MTEQCLLMSKQKKRKHRHNLTIPAQWRLEETSGGLFQSNLLPKAGSSRAGCQESQCTGMFGMSPAFCHGQMELPGFQFLPIAPCLTTGHHQKESMSIFLLPTLQLLISIVEIHSHSAPLQANQPHIAQPSLRCSPISELFSISL